MGGCAKARSHRLCARKVNQWNRTVQRKVRLSLENRRCKSVVAHLHEEEKMFECLRKICEHGMVLLETGREEVMRVNSKGR